MTLRGRRGTYAIDPASKREGGQAEVYRARSADGRTHAVKIPKHGRSHTFFEREVSHLRQLASSGHPGIVPYVDDGTAPDGRPFVVIEWFELALDEWLETRPTVEKVFEALTQACESVVRLHRAPGDLARVLVHRDVKPYNFLVREVDGRVEVVLADLGLAKEGVVSEASTQTGLYTEYYAPPEQQLPLAFPPDPSMDVHGLAATVWQAICGRVPRSLFSRPAAWKEATIDLRALQGLGARRTAEDEARYEAMRRRPIEDYADFEVMTALTPKDEADFEESLASALNLRTPDPYAVARAVAEKLVPALRRALEPDWHKRTGEAQRVYAAVRVARDAVVAAVAEPVGRAGAPTPPQPPAPPDLRPGSAETFERGDPRATRELPTLHLDAETDRPARPGMRVVRAQAPPATVDPSRTLDPNPTPPRRSRALVVAGVSAVFTFVCVFGIGGLAVWWWQRTPATLPEGSAPAEVAPPPSPAPAPDATAEVAPAPEPDAPKVETAKPDPKPTPKPAAPQEAEAPPAATPPAPVALTVKGCASLLGDTDVVLDGVAGLHPTLTAASHMLKTTTHLASGAVVSKTWPVRLDADGLRLAGTLYGAPGSSLTLRLDDEARLVRTCP